MGSASAASSQPKQAPGSGWSKSAPQKNKEEQTLRHFKQVLKNGLELLRSSADAETAYMYWVNRNRQQFVLESSCSSNREVSFQDRVGFEHHFLNAFKNLTDARSVAIGSDMDAGQLTHHPKPEGTINSLLLVPFRNNGETVALTVVESDGNLSSEDLRPIVRAYNGMVTNVFETYLEISTLRQSQQQWNAYDERLQELTKSNAGAAQLLVKVMGLIEGLMPGANISLVAESMQRWTNVMNSAQSANPLPLGLPLEKQSLAWKALESGDHEFSIHFNNSPKRMAAREGETKGATLTVPIMFDGQRKAAIVVYGNDALAFSSPAKHKIINAVRMAGLMLERRLSKNDQKTFLRSSNGALVPDLWEPMIDNTLAGLSATSAFNRVGLVTLAQLSELRTRLRLEELNRMQQYLVQALYPGQYGCNGIVGFYSDYLYMIFLQGKSEASVQQYDQKVHRRFESPLDIGRGVSLNLDLAMQFEPLSDAFTDSYSVISNLKRKLK